MNSILLIAVTALIGILVYLSKKLFFDFDWEALNSIKFVSSKLTIMSQKPTVGGFDKLLESRDFETLVYYAQSNALPGIKSGLDVIDPIRKAQHYVEGAVVKINSDFSVTTPILELTIDYVNLLIYRLEIAYRIMSWVYFSRVISVVLITAILIYLVLLLIPV